MLLVFILFAVSSSGSRVVQHEEDPEQRFASFRSLLAPRGVAALTLGTAPGALPLRAPAATMLAKKTTWSIGTSRKKPKRAKSAKDAGRVRGAGFGQPAQDAGAPAPPSAEPAPAEKDAAGADVAVAADPEEEQSEEERLAAWRAYADAAVAAAEAHEKKVAEEENEKKLAIFRLEEDDE